jgi:uncharacterized protein (PEP-CTERM system associated)
MAKMKPAGIGAPKNVMHAVQRSTRKVAGSAQLAVLFLAASQAPAALAVDWRITPGLDLRETWSDNVNLGGDGNKQSDFVSEIAPNLSVYANSRRLKVNARYQLRALYYANGSQANDLVNQFNGAATAELIDELLFVDANGYVSRQNASSFGPQSANNSYTTTNQAQVRNFSVSPYLRHRFGSAATTEARYTHTSSRSDASGLSNSETDSINANINSGTAFTTVGWGAFFNKQNSSYSQSESQQSQSQGGDVRLRVSNTLDLTAAGGYESFSYAPTDGEKPEGAYWRVGFGWAPSSRTKIDATFGRRYYGNAYSFNGYSRNRLAVTTLSYTEDVTTTQEQFAQVAQLSTALFLDQLFAASIPDAALRQQAVEAFIRNNNLPSSFATSANSLSNRVFLQKRLQGSMAFNASKTAIVFSAYSTRREAQSGAQADASLLATNNFALDADSQTAGVSGAVNVRLSPTASANLSTQYSRTKSLVSDRRDDSKSVSMALSKQFQPKLRGSVEVRRQQNSSNSFSDSVENSITAYLSMQL